MLRAFAGEELARPALDAAAALLGRRPELLLEEISDEGLHASRTGQLLCVTRALAAAALLFDGRPPPRDLLIAGYSVGEMAAWGVAGVWSVADTLRLTEARARAMDAAGGADGGLGYIRGLPFHHVRTLAARFGCAIAIVNPGDLFVLGGARDAVAALCAAALAAGAQRGGALPVRAAALAARLAAAVAPFQAALADTPANRPAAQLLSATDQRLVRDPPAAIGGLARQVATAIDWAATLDALRERGVARVLELGPGCALAEMVRTAAPECDARAVDDFRTVAGARAWLLH